MGKNTAAIIQNKNKSIKNIENIVIQLYLAKESQFFKKYLLIIIKIYSRK